MRLRKTGAQLLHQFQFLGYRQRGAPPDELGERLAPDVFHHDERRSLELARVVDVDDVRMVQRGKGPGFARKPFAKLRRVERRVQQLERDETVRVRIAGEIQVAHAAAADPALDLVTADVGRLRSHR